MKTWYIAILLLTFSSVSVGQTIRATGKISDDKNQPVPYAFIRDVKHNYATFSDSTGFFSIKADPASALEIAANNYKTETLKLNGNNEMAVKLVPGNTTSVSVASITGENTSTPPVNSFLQNSQLISSTTSVGGTTNAGASKTIVKEGFNLEPTRGSRYLYDKWIVGYGLNKKDSLVVELTNAYNYDKVTGGIVYTNDGRYLSSLNKDIIKTFTLFDKDGHANLYESTTLFPNKIFVEVLLSTTKYKIFKKVDTKLIQADFRTNGVIESGHKYDEYVDVVRYYFVGQDGKPNSISLKKSNLKKLLGTDADAFISVAGSRDIDEQYIRDLGNSLADK